jgi:hypothetical protein
VGLAQGLDRESPRLRVLWEKKKNRTSHVASQTCVLDYSAYVFTAIFYRIVKFTITMHETSFVTATTFVIFYCWLGETTPQPCFRFFPRFDTFRGKWSKGIFEKSHRSDDGKLPGIQIRRLPLTLHVAIRQEIRTNMVVVVWRI